MRKENNKITIKCNQVCEKDRAPSKDIQKDHGIKSIINNNKL